MEPVANSTPIGSAGKLQDNVAIPYQFTIGNLINESWKRVKGVKATYWGATILYILIYVALTGVGLGAIYLYASFNPAVTDITIPVTVTKIITSLITLPLPFGLSYLALRRSVNLPVKIKQIFKAYSFYWQIFSIIAIIYVGIILMVTVTFFAATLLSAFIKTENTTLTWLYYIPMIVCVLGGFATLYFLFSLSFAPLLVIEKQFGIFQALKTSFLAFKQRGLKIMLAFLCLFIIYFIGVIPLGIGLIWTLPLLYNGMGILYRIQFGVDER